MVITPRRPDVTKEHTATIFRVEECKARKQQEADGKQKFAHSSSLKT
jgi:hypothetical protein